MSRVKRFWRNAGIRGILVVIILIALVVQSFRSGLWIYTAPLLVVMFLVTYLFRGWLVERFETVRTVMNTLAIVAVIASVILRRLVPSESFWLALATVGLLGAYLGCYFWLLSDESIVPLS